jgi:hypothetical protein
MRTQRKTPEVGGLEDKKTRGLEDVRQEAMKARGSRSFLRIRGQG